MPNPVESHFSVEWEKQHETYIERRFTFRSDENEIVPCHLLIPHAAPKPCPTVICLQGHSRGMHISLGKTKFDDDEEMIIGGRDFALQTVRRGYAALTVEQRAMGANAAVIRSISHAAIFLRHASFYMAAPYWADAFMISCVPLICSGFFRSWI